MMRLFYIIPILFCSLLMYGQTTQEYFSRPGLNINSYHQCYVDCGFSTSYTFSHKQILEGDTVLKFVHNEGHEFLSLWVDQKKVFIYSSSSKVLLYDFGLEVDDVVAEGYYYGSTVVLKADTTLLNGEKRLKLELVRSDSTEVTWVEGIGDVDRGLATAYDPMAVDYFFCAGDSTGYFLLNPEEIENCERYSCVVPYPGFEFEQNDFTLSFSNQTLFGKHYHWDFGNGNTSVEENPVYTYPEPGCYFLKLTVSNDCYHDSIELQKKVPICIAPDWGVIDSISFSANFKLFRCTDQIQYIFRDFATSNLFRSGDNGKTWNTVILPQASGSRKITDIAMFDALRGILTCQYTNSQSNTIGVLVTSDGGITWMERPEVSMGMKYVVLGSSGQAWVSGDNWTIDKNGFFRSLDYGETWTDLSTSLSGELEEIWNIDDEILITSTFKGLHPPPLGYYYLNTSTDAGIHWDEKVLPAYIGRIYFKDDSIGFGYDYDLGQKGLYKTVDGGLSWSLVLPDIRVRDIEFWDTKAGWVSDGSGIVYYTTDGMQTYQKTNCIGSWIQSLNPLSTKEVLAVSRNSIVYYKGNTGESCTELDNDQDGYYGDVDCDDENPDINPLAVEIPDNGVDEDCDGIDLVTQVLQPGLSTFEVFPNPASEFLYFSDEVPEGIQLEVFDMTGHILYKQTGIEPIDVSVFSPGIYLIRVTSIEKRSAKTQKLVIVK